MELAGTYIRAVRDARDLSRAAVWGLSGVHESQIARIENGTQDAGYVSVFAVLRAVRGNALDVQRLMSDKHATVEQAEELGKAFAERTKLLTNDDPDLDRVLAEEHDREHDDGHGVDRVRATHIIDALLDDTDLLSQWLDYGEYLVSRRV